MKKLFLVLALLLVNSVASAATLSLPIQQIWQTAADWTANNPVLLAGELGFESDQDPPKWKVGDGVTAWNSLAYEGANIVCSDITDSTAAGCAMLQAATVAAQQTLLNVEDGADVTDTTNVTAAGAVMDSEVTSLSGIKTLTVPDSTTISVFGATLTDDADAATARTTLGVDASGTDNSTDVTLAGTPDYITILGQELTLGQIDLAADVTGDLPIAEGGTGQSTAQAAIDALTQVSGATNEYVLTKDTASGNALWKVTVQPNDDAATLGSGAANDGYVLTADGIGGAAWEVQTGGGSSGDIIISEGGSADSYDVNSDNLIDEGDSST